MGTFIQGKIQQNSTTIEKTMESELAGAIFDETEDRFSLAGSTPIGHCSISDDLGLLGFTPLGEQITSGNFNPPPNLDEAISALLEGAGILYQQFWNNHVNIKITPE